MGLAHSPKIVTDGLAFIYDTGSGKSYKGEPTVNLLNYTTEFNNWTAAKNSGTTPTVTVDTSVNPLGLAGAPMADKVYLPDDGTYPRIQQYFTPASTNTHTFSVWIRSISGNCDCFLGAFRNSPWSLPGSSVKSITGEWQRFTFSWTPPDTTTHVIYMGSHDTAAQKGNTLEFWGAQMEAKSHATQFVDGTRSATQGLLDLTNNATINLSNVSFDSNAQMVFDGTDDYTSLGNPTALRDLTSGTIETVYYRDASSGTYQMVFTDAGSDLEITYLGNTLQFYIGNSGLSYTHAVTDQWFNVVGTWGSGFKKLYINGVEVASGTNTGTDTGNRDRYVGGRGANFPFNGEIPIARIYGQALTDEEVLQNYNAFKSRFL